MTTHDPGSTQPTHTLNATQEPEGTATEETHRKNRRPTWLSAIIAALTLTVLFYANVLKPSPPVPNPSPPGIIICTASGVGAQANCGAPEVMDAPRPRVS